MNNMRYFLADEAAYELSRHALNAAWGIPNPGTVTALPSASSLLKHQGRVVFSVDKWMCELTPAPDMIASAIVDDTLLEITEEEFSTICRAAYQDL